MRIAVLCTDQGVRVPGTKGASLHLRDITRAFAYLGHEVLLVGVAGHGEPPTGVATHLLPHPGRAEGLVRERNKLALTERFRTELAPVLADFGPDLVYERLALFGDAGVDLAEGLGVPHVLEVNALLAREEATWRGLHLVDEAVGRELDVLRRTHRAVAVSREVGQQITSASPLTPVGVVPNGFDEDAFCGSVDRTAVRERLGLPVDAPTAVFVGNLRPWHGVEIAVRALTSAPGMRLVVVGDGPEATGLADLARELGVQDRLVLAGRRPHRECVAIIRSCDVALAPYPPLDDFGFSPLKVFEYLAAGLPVVASEIGQLRDLATEFEGIRLTPPGDAAALGRAVAAVAIDPAAAGRAGRDRARALAGCGWRSRARQILELPLGAPA